MSDVSSLTGSGATKISSESLVSPVPSLHQQSYHTYTKTSVLATDPKHPEDFENMDYVTKRPYLQGEGQQYAITSAKYVTKKDIQQS